MACPGGDVDEPVALDRPHERDSAPRQLPLGIADARVEIGRGWAERGRKCDAAAGAPLQNPIARQLAADADQRAAAVGCMKPFSSMRSMSTSSVTPDGPSARRRAGAFDIR